MAKKLNLALPPVDDPFSTQEERDSESLEKVQIIPIDEIDRFPDHPFQVRNDENLVKLIESIKEIGVQTPVICRKKEDGRYELISGHRRKIACGFAGIKSMPVIVRDISRDDAIILMVDSNLQREKILPSEKAFSYKMKLEAMNRQGKRIDLTSVPMEPKLRSNILLAQDSGESVAQIKRYIRLAELIPEVLDMVDENKIAFRPAVEVSFLSKDEQKSLLKTMEIDEVTPSLSQAIKLKKFSQENRLRDDVILSIMSEEKPNQIEQFKIPRERINKFFPDDTPKEKIEATIIKALEEFKKREKNRGMER